MRKKLDASLIILAITALGFTGAQWRFSGKQAETEQLVEATANQAHANCVVVSVLLANRADRDETLKLFEPIRRQNPAQFDKLVERAEKGDKRLASVQGDLACRVPKPPKSE